jgi:hypothetical protein
MRLRHRDEIRGAEEFADLDLVLQGLLRKRLLAFSKSFWSAYVSGSLNFRSIKVLHLSWR